jgi:hydroxybutyrate-dimer hydrolase
MSPDHRWHGSFFETDMKTLIVVLLLALMACSQPPRPNPEEPVEVLKSVYHDGRQDDLLTAGLGLAGLRGTPPELDSPPTAEQLRRLSYYQQFRALNDLSETGGYGRLFGIAADQPAVAGWEYWAQRQLADGAHHTVVLHIPDDFSASQACLVVAPSSGSRNVFGAVGTSGAWALSRGCAVVYTDKGTGTEIALRDDRVYRIDGLLSAAGDELQAGTKLITGTEFQIAQKHAYSQAHPEQLWGQFVLDAADFASRLVMQQKQLTRGQLKVIAASVSNGGGAVLRAAEQDHTGLLDAVVAAEPQVNLRHAYVWQGLDGHSQPITTRPLLELSMQLAVLEPCAALAAELDQAPFKLNTGLLMPLLQQRCQQLADAGMVNGDSSQQQATDALRQIKQLGLESEALQLAQINTLANMWAAINHTYSNSYLRKQVTDNLCHSAMSAFTPQGQPRTLTLVEEQAMFALSNGIAPGNGIELGVTNDEQQVTGRLLAAPGYGLATQLCFRDLLNQADLQQAIGQVLAKPQDNHLPTLILHGQADGTVAVNHASRAYYHQNQQAGQPNPLMRYYDIERVQHFDAFLAYPGFVERFVPMHPYFEQALEVMFEHLFHGRDLPPSQMVKTAQRTVSAGQPEPLTTVHVPPLAVQPEHPLQVNNNRLEVKQP